MLKKGNVVTDADDDDEVRTSVSQNHAATTLSTEECFLRTQLSPHINKEMRDLGEEQDIDGPWDT